MHPVCSGDTYARVPAMNSGGSGAWRWRGSRDVIPKPVSLIWPASPLGSNATNTFSGLTFLVDQTPLVGMAERCCQANRQA